MENKVAKIISFLFHPLLMPTYSFVLLFSINAYFSMIIPIEAKWRLLLFVFILTFVFPLISIVFLYNRKMISSLYMKERKERTLPFFITTIFYFTVFYLLKGLNLSPIFQYYALGASLLVVAALVINFFWKISIHMIGIGGLLGMLIGLSIMGIINNILALFGGILIAGFIGFARLQLKNHTQAQVYGGLLLGLFGMLYLARFF